MPIKRRKSVGKWRLERPTWPRLECRFLEAQALELGA